jgi:hypothetical protein
MPRKPNPPPDDEEQAKRFVETAKALEADKTGEEFDKALSAVVPNKPQASTKPNKQRKV